MPQQQVAGAVATRQNQPSPGSRHLPTTHRKRWQDLSGVLHSSEGTELFTFGDGTPRPVSASWPGVAAVVKEVARVTAPVHVWKETAHKYSFAGGGLGTAGKVHFGKYFLESCTFGDNGHAGCCAEGANVTFQELAGAAG